ncbi:MAG: 4-hydroxy-tetrahydrodipicolinate reductase [Bacteroidales bacterium]|nr:4-hydroxy-tetrahydrodipicolinate reductase [Bacteroidales bacterium]
MKIAIIGYGKMGKTIEKLALAKGYKIILKIDDTNLNDLTVDNLKKADVAIEFTNPESAFTNINLCFDAGIPVISGTTGWLDKFEDIKQRCESENKAFFYASNYSLGVNIFFKLNKYLAKMMNRFDDFEVQVEETHHIHKLDAPSGTAITIAEGIISEIDRKKEWVKEKADRHEQIAVKSYREGEIAGIHTVTYSSNVEDIIITHNSKNREGLAQGALMAAEFIIGKSGIFGMDDLLMLTV